MMSLAYSTSVKKAYSPKFFFPIFERKLIMVRYLIGQRKNILPSKLCFVVNVHFHRLTNKRATHNKIQNQLSKTTKKAYNNNTSSISFMCAMLTKLTAQFTTTIK